MIQKTRKQKLSYKENKTTIQQLKFPSSKKENKLQAPLISEQTRLDQVV
jgi:hypothetical protein